MNKTLSSYMSIHFWDGFLIKAPESNDILVRLRKDLTIDSQSYDPYMSDWRFQSDILSILRNIHKTSATLIANSWELVYRTGGN
jgi:hypothetical protein